MYVHASVDTMMIVLINYAQHASIHAALAQMEVNAFPVNYKPTAEHSIRTIFVSALTAFMMMVKIISFACPVFIHV